MRNLKTNRFIFLLLLIAGISFQKLLADDVGGETSSPADNISQGVSMKGTQGGSGTEGIFQNNFKISPMDLWDVDWGLALPFPSPQSVQSYLSLWGNGLFEAIAEEGVQRGGGDFSAPNIFSLDGGTRLGNDQYLNLNLLLTSDLWTMPKGGSLQLMQIGPTLSNGTSFTDTQNPSSSPILGLTLSDTIALDLEDKSNLKLFVAPRGESTDGPMVYLYRITAMVNPDTPLGFRDGQDVGLDSNTVIGESLKLGGFHLEASIFNGLQADPTQVNLPMGSPNSYAFRLIQEFSPQVMAMVSYAYVDHPTYGIGDEERYSASFYTNLPLSDHWTWNNSLIYGGITHLDDAEDLNSTLEEFAFVNSKMAFYGRMEVLQRTPNELGIPGLPDPNSGRWLTAITMGYSHQVTTWDGWELRAGAQVSNDLTPSEYSMTYSGNPLSYKFYFQLGVSQHYGF